MSGLGTLAFRGGASEKRRTVLPASFQGLVLLPVPLWAKRAVQSRRWPRLPAEGSALGQQLPRRSPARSAAGVGAAWERLARQSPRAAVARWARGLGDAGPLTVRSPGSWPRRCGLAALPANAGRRPTCHTARVGLAQAGGRRPRCPARRAAGPRRQGAPSSCVSLPSTRHARASLPVLPRLAADHARSARPPRPAAAS